MLNLIPSKLTGNTAIKIAKKKRENYCLEIIKNLLSYYSLGIVLATDSGYLTFNREIKYKSVVIIIKKRTNRHVNPTMQFKFSPQLS